MIARILSWVGILPRKPETPKWAKNDSSISVKYSWKHKKWMTYCNFCGGNCGQCGQTGRFLEANDGIPMTFNMGTIWKNSGMGKFDSLIHGLRRK